VVLVMLVAATLYARGSSSRPRRPWRDAAFAGALLTVATALLSPLDTAADQLFSAHMVQHLLLLVVAAPLFVLAHPVQTISASISGATRRNVLGRRAGRTVLRARRWIRRPAPAWTIATVALWAWHLPTLYQAALEEPLLHAVEHATFLLTAMLVWSVALDVRSGGTLGGLGRCLFLVACAIQSALLGAIVLFAPVVLYPGHGAGPAAWGLTPLQDQQLAGVLMWVPPSGVYLVAAVLIFVRWMHRLDATPPLLGSGRERWAA